jgi:trehalose/maltose transport system substrate-binding protein
MPAGSTRVAPLPSGPGGRAQTIGGFSLAVSGYSSQVQEAAALLLYLTGIQVQTRRAIARGFLPTYAEAYRRADLARALPEARTLFDASNQGSVLRPSTVSGKKYAQVSKAYYETVHKILARSVRAESALADLHAKLASLMNTEVAAGNDP